MSIPKVDIGCYFLVIYHLQEKDKFILWIILRITTHIYIFNIKL